MVVAHPTAKLDFKPIITIAEGQTLVDIDRLRDALLRLGHTVDAGIAHIVVVTGIGEGVDIEVGCAVEGSVEHQAGIGIPVTVDVLRTCDTGTRAGVEGYLVTDGIARSGESCPGGNGTLVGLHVVVVEETEVLRERGFQSRITNLDVQRVAVVNDLKQVAHLRLVDVGEVVHTQLAHL